MLTGKLQNQKQQLPKKQKTPPTKLKTAKADVLEVAYVGSTI